MFKLVITSLFLLSFVSSSSSSFFLKDDLVFCRPDQVQTLMEFKNEFDSRYCNQNSNFNKVRCDNITGEVKKLKISGCLSGTLKPNSSLFKLHHLRFLNLSENNFLSSSIPSEFGNLNGLEVLSLPSNGFLGQIPSSFSNLSLLYFLDLSHNELTEPISKLTTLKHLDVSYLHTHYPIDLNIFSSLKSLVSLDISGNSISPTSLSLNLNIPLKNLTYLTMSRCGIREFPNILKTLRNLELIDISNNMIKGKIPKWVWSLPRLLEVLDLSSNGFLGQVPSSISNLSLLYKLNLSYNELTGSFPLLRNLTKLSSLDLDYNHFSGKLSPSSKNSLFEMHNLRYLSLCSNNFSSNLPSEFGKLNKLNVLLLSSNDFFGNIPPTISNLTLLSFLYLDKNQFTGGFPLVGNLTKLSYLALSYNSFSGTIPSSLFTMPFLSYLDLLGNNFSGPIELPKSSLSSSLDIFSALGNSFTGEIPLSICNRKSLTTLELRYNNFSGTFPPCLTNLTIVNLRNNNLEGSIPDTFQASASIRSLDLGYNQLTGKLPKSLLNCSSLQFLGVENNMIEDTFPFWLKALPKLQILTLRSNKFYGPISPSHQGPLGFPELRILEISNNKFTGCLTPNYFMNWKASSPAMNKNGGLYMVYIKDIIFDYISYTYTDSMDLQYKGLYMAQARVQTSYSAIDFSGNLLQGQIPNSIGLLKSLIALNLSNNVFTGHIPPSFSNLVELESLDLSRNQLSGNIPNGLKDLSYLAYINMSHNHLMGEIPQGTQINGQPKSSFEGNAGLCGLPLEESCFGTNVPTTQKPKEEADEEEEEQVLNWKGVVIGYGLGVLLGLIIAQVIASYKPEWLAKIIGGPKKLRNR
ncbi:unnamed protein product [Cochlearia groenlandica]